MQEIFFTGEALEKLGTFYAKAIVESQLNYDLLFGPAYKGIPLVSAVACALYRHFGRQSPWSFNRKEAKDHGEGGVVVGAPLAGDVLLIDDVMTAGTAIRESIELIHQHKAKPVGVYIMLDREERGLGQLSAIQEIKVNYNVQAHALITLSDLIHYLSLTKRYNEQFEKMNLYKEQYGV